MSCDRPAVLEEAGKGALNACEGRREEVGDLEKADTEGDLKQSSRESALTALTGVTGEAIDLVAVGVSIGEGTKVDKEEKDSEVDEIEPC